MAAPNIVNVTNIIGNSASLAISSTSDPFATALINNPASSGKVYKINSIIAANVDGVAAVDVTVSIFTQDDLGGTARPLVYQIPVPAESSLVVLDKETAFYLLEDQSVGVTASAANDLVVSASWEEIS